MGTFVSNIKKINTLSGITGNIKLQKFYAQRLIFLLKRVSFIGLRVRSIHVKETNMVKRQLSLEPKIQSLLDRKKALEQKQAHLLYSKCRSLMKDDFHMGIIINLIEEVWMQKTPEQLARWEKQAESRNTKSDQTSKNHPTASSPVQK